jgi:GT2 family glycosyltransferase
LLERSLWSVGDQDYRSLEVVVVDDVSTDETPAVVERLSRLLGRGGIPVQLVELPVNSGPAVARNRGVAAARGSLLSFLDSDDLMEAAFVSTLVELLDRHAGCTLGFSGAWEIDADDRKVGVLDSGLADEPREGVLHTPLDRLARHELFQTSSVVMRRETFEDEGGFDETLRYSEDTDLWWRLAKRDDFAYTVEPLVCHRFHADNVSRNEEALADSIRVHLRHLADVRDPVSRSAHTGRIQRRQVLLQEKLLRDRRPAEEYRELLDTTVAPSTLRYRIGRRLVAGPAPLRQAYVSGIRAARGVRRMLTRARAGDFSKPS